MKKLTKISFGLVVAALFFAAGQAQATVTTNKLTFKATVRTQGDYSYNEGNNTEKSTVDKSKLTEKTIIQEICSDLDIVVPDGAYLEVILFEGEGGIDADVYLKGKNTEPVDVSDFFGFYGNPAELWEGSYDYDNGKEKGKGYGFAGFEFESEGLYFYLEGSAEEKFSAGAAKDGVIKEKGTIAIKNGSGEIEYGEESGIIDGSAELKGKDTVEWD